MHAIERAKNILLQPAATWPVVQAESSSVADIYRNYVLLLAAIPAVCGFIGMSMIGYSVFGVAVRVPLLSGLVNLVISYVFSLIGVFVLGLIIDALASSFGGTRNALQAFKVAAYSSTAAMVAGIFSLVPSLAPLAIIGALYSIYLLYAGLPVLMHNPREKSAGYTAVVVLCAIVAGILLAGISALLVPSPVSPLVGATGAGAFSIDTPRGNVSIDTSAIEAATKRLEASAQQIQQGGQRADAAASLEAAGAAIAAAAGGFASNGAGAATAVGAAITAARLKEFLPAQLGGLPRISVAARDGGAGGVPYSTAEAQYGTNDAARSLAVEMIDAGAFSDFPQMAAAAGQSEQETATSMEKTFQQDGRLVHQRYEKDGSDTELRITLKNGVMVTLSATEMNVQQVQSASAQLGLDALESIARPKK